MESIFASEKERALMIFMEKANLLYKTRAGITVLGPMEKYLLIMICKTEE